MDADLRGVRPGPDVAGGEEAGRPFLHLQRPCHVVLLRSLFLVHARYRRITRSRTKAAARASCRRCAAIRARRVGAALMADEFDLSVFQNRALDHGCFSPLSVMLPHETKAGPRIVPLLIGVLQFPIPTARRCYRLGQALRRAIESYPEDIKVALVATGGLSHQVHGERAGFHRNGTAIHGPLRVCARKDRRDDACRARHARRPRRRRGHHVARDARRARPKIRCLHRAYYLPSMTGIATAIYEDIAVGADPTRSHARANAGPAVDGVERLRARTPSTSRAA